jgi:hypothetical protein
VSRDRIDRDYEQPAVTPFFQIRNNWEWGWSSVAAERLREVLHAAYGKNWSDLVLHRLLTDAGCKAGTTLDDWLRNQFFEQHCKRFQNRPFIWHIWDGRKDGLCVGAKTVENRSRSPLYRGQVAIHAGANKAGLEHYIGQDSWDESLREFFSFGAIIGMAELYDSVPFGRSLRDDAWAEGPLCLVFRHPRLFLKPIPYKGRVNLCELPVDVAKCVEEGKSECVDVESIGLRERCLRAIPAGRIPKELLPRP